MKIKIITIQQTINKGGYRAGLHGTEIDAFAKTEVESLKNLVKKLESNNPKYILSNLNKDKQL